MSRKLALPMAREMCTLVVQELPDEILVYDPSRRSIHYLDFSTAFVWRHCDGSMKVRELADLLERDFNVASGVQELQLAITRLKKLHLVQ